MTASNGDQCSSASSPNGSPAYPLSDAIAAKDDLIVNTRVTYAPLAVWKDYHWACTVTSFTLPVRDRLE